jgi:hypothetical protein
MPHPRRTTTILCTAAAALAAAALGACNIVGPVGFLVAGEEKVPALYQLDKDRSVVVFVDDRASRVPEITARVLIGRTAEKALADQRLVREIISSEGVSAVVARERFGQPMGIADVGAAVGAQTVIYATIDEFTLSVDRTTFAPRAVARLKVVDTESRKRLWPTEDPGWHTVVVQLDERQGTVPTGPGDVGAAQRDLAARLGDAIAKVFYAHQRHVGSERIGR